MWAPLQASDWMACPGMAGPSWVILRNPEQGTCNVETGQTVLPLFLRRSLWGSCAVLLDVETMQLFNHIGRAGSMVKESRAFQHGPGSQLSGESLWGWNSELGRNTRYGANPSRLFSP